LDDLIVEENPPEGLRLSVVLSDVQKNKSRCKVLKVGKVKFFKKNKNTLREMREME
jgi:hypothetical protein